MSDQPYPVGAVRTSFTIIEALREAGTAGVTELAEETGTSKGSVHKHLTTLRSLGYVVKTDRRYSLGYRFLGLGCRMRGRSALFRVARPAIDNLADTSGAIVNLIVPEQGYGIYLYRAGDSTAVQGYLPSLGERIYLHATAGGKAILSQLPREAVETIIETTGLPKLTAKTTTEPEELFTMLRSVRDRELAFERGEHLPSVQCVAAPITTEEGPIGAVSVSGSIDTMSGKKLEEDLAGLVISTANEIELQLFSQ